MKRPCRCHWNHWVINIFMLANGFANRHLPVFPAGSMSRGIFDRIFRQDAVLCRVYNKTYEALKIDGIARDNLPIYQNWIFNKDWIRDHGWRRPKQSWEQCLSIAPDWCFGGRWRISRHPSLMIAAVHDGQQTTAPPSKELRVEDWHWCRLRFILEYGCD